MPRDDYEAIAKIIEDVVGSDTLMAVKLLEGIKFYYDNKVEKIQVIRPEGVSKSFNPKHSTSKFKEEADSAMKRYTAKLRKESAKYRKRKKKDCSTSG